FFNLLTIALCVPLLEDTFFPARLRAFFVPAAGREGYPRSRFHLLRLPVAAGILMLSLVPFLQNCGIATHWPGWLARIYTAAASFRSVNSYGLFAVMTTTRPEIIVEGSDEGETWKPYEFVWKPGDPSRRPRFTGLHMPRLDWQMWFAALGSRRENTWFVSF